MDVALVQVQQPVSIAECALRADAIKKPFCMLRTLRSLQRMRLWRQELSEAMTVKVDGQLLQSDFARFA
ncbi:MAG TPA: hypothetical protein EYP10_02060 [Armatimonadetes bacterium]|nr:hypothetical protein [Armatimonadota bacterium]